MIPKIIHYIWFGGEKSAIAKRALHTWKKRAPEYRIIEWNEKNLPLFSNKYYQEALLTKNYAFASDYARLKILQKFGGLYMDTDMYLLENPNEILASRDLVFSVNTNPPLMSTSLIGASKNNEFINEALTVYSRLEFEKKANPYILTPILERMYGFKEKDITQSLDSGSVIALNSNILLQPSFKAVALHVGEFSWGEKTWRDKARILMRTKITAQVEAGIFRKINDICRKVI